MERLLWRINGPNHSVLWSKKNNVNIAVKKPARKQTWKHQFSPLLSFQIHSSLFTIEHVPPKAPIAQKKRLTPRRYRMQNCFRTIVIPFLTTRDQYEIAMPN